MNGDKDNVRITQNFMTMFYGIAWLKKQRTNLIGIILCLLLGGKWSSVRYWILRAFPVIANSQHAYAVRCQAPWYSLVWRLSVVPCNWYSVLPCQRSDFCPCLWTHGLYFSKYSLAMLFKSWVDKLTAWQLLHSASEHGQVFCPLAEDAGKACLKALQWNVRYLSCTLSPVLGHFWLLF